MEGKVLFEQHAQEWLVNIKAVGQPLEVAHRTRGRPRFWPTCEAAGFRKASVCSPICTTTWTLTTTATPSTGPSCRARPETTLINRPTLTSGTEFRTALSEWIMTGQMREDLRQRGTGNGRV